MLTLTGSASLKVKELIQAEGDEALALRVAVRPGGCSGYSYEMYFDKDFTPDDNVVEDDKLATIAFTHCPYAELAAAHPEVVCHLHRGLVEGFVESIGGAGVDRFRTLADRDPCQVELSVR